jgi:hypothetical protein
MEAESYRRLFRRVTRNIFLLAVAGAAVAAAWRGWRAGLLFVVGAAASYFSFFSLRRMMESFGPGAHPARGRVFLFFSFRFVLLALGAYAIVKFFGLNAIAALAGLFVPVAAITFEIVYEFIHGT